MISGQSHFMIRCKEFVEAAKEEDEKKFRKNVARVRFTNDAAI